MNKMSMQPGQPVLRNEGDMGGNEALRGEAPGAKKRKRKPVVPAPAVTINLKRRGAWTNRPSVVGQYTDPRYAAFVRKGPLIPAVFDLGKPAQVKKLVALLARANPNKDPEIHVQGDVKQVVGSKWLCCVTYQVIEYQQIIVATPNDLPAAPK